MEDAELARMLARGVYKEVAAYALQHKREHSDCFSKFSAKAPSAESCRNGRDITMLKNVQMFNKFDAEAFFKGKKLLFIKASEWQERDPEGNVSRLLGSKVQALIAEDKTDYGSAKASANFGETITIKVKDIAPSAFAKLEPMKTILEVQFAKATVYGPYRNELSLIASNIEVSK